MLRNAKVIMKNPIVLEIQDQYIQVEYERKNRDISEFMHKYVRAHVMGYGMNSIRKMCGAKTRQGTPCKNTRLYNNGRCKNHGGLSTGPRTEEGKTRALANLIKP